MSKILIVDDERSIRLTLGKFLDEAGHEVQVAEDAAAGLALVREQTFDLVISDIVLPRMSGVELVKAIRALSPDLPVVMMTGEPTVETAVEAVRAGAFDYLSKPITKLGILRVVEQVGRLRNLQLEKERLEAANRAYQQDLERMVAERTGALRDQARLLDLAHDAIAVTDIQGLVRYWNQSCEQLTGRPAAQALGHPLVELLQPDPTTYQEAWQSASASGQWNGELRLGTDRGPATMLSRWTLVRDARGQPQSMLVISTDITEQKKLEARFLRAQRMDSVGQLAGGVAHDLNNILAPILMSISLLRDEVITESGSAILDTMESSAQRGADIIRQLLTFARGTESQKIPVPAHRLITEMSRIIEETFPKSISLSTAAAPNLWPVLGDPTQLHQVLLNLCVNARDAMPDGGTLTISAQNALLDACYLRLAPEGKPGPHVILQVSDTGSGMPPATLNRLFEPFFTTKDQGKGTGLGLATVLGIVKGHGGFIQVESQVGQGSLFKVHLPAVQTNQTAAGAEATPAPLPQGRGELVLVVEDELSLRNITQRILEKNGYRVLAAREGSEALNLFVKHQQDIRVLLTDMMMPVMDGEGTIRVLRNLQPGLRVIAVSGLALKPIFTEDPLMKVQACLHKPYTTIALLSTIRQVLDEQAC